VKPYRVISFDGGGVRGAFTTQVLKRLCEPPYNIDLNSVNLFAGTSTGSVIAAGLAMGLGIDKVSRFYEESNCKHIFSQKRILGGWLSSKYKREPLAEFLSAHYVGDPTLEELPRGVSLSSFQLDSPYSNEWLSVFFHNHQDFSKHKRLPAFDYRKIKLVDAVLASSAAPTYFPAYHIEGHGNFIDGGVVANNPGIAGLSVAANPINTPHANINDIRLLSIGNGRALSHVTGAPNWGLYQWTVKSPHPLINIMSDGSSDSDHYYCMSILGDRYRRLQIDLPKPIMLDDYHEVPQLVSLANSTDPKFESELAEIAEWFNAPDKQPVSEVQAAERLSIEDTL
jgi:patatin-like phospholipase/acyl hydrolase